MNPRFDQTTDGATAMPMDAQDPIPPLKAVSAYVDVDVEWSEAFKRMWAFAKRWNMEDGTSMLLLPQASLEVELCEGQALTLHSSRSMQGIHL